ncbi:MAG: T9SS type A sorting domain-containing protein [Flavobacterium sp.]|nr:T9SS type A sorting domain-containing protein [Flavobacterium sp.]
MNQNEYYQYQVTPTAGNKITVSSVTLNHSVTNGNWVCAVYYSFDGFATAGTQIGSNFNSNSTSQTAQSFTGLSYVVPTGGSFTIRVYAWESDGSNRRFRNRNVVISGSSCALTSITTQPSSVSACEGASVTLSVSATNATSYQWKRNNVAIGGQTSNSLTFASLSLSDAASYTVDAISSCNTISSNAAVLTVNPKPTALTVTPSSATVCANEITTLVATGGLTTVPILSENFNGASNNWTLENTSTGGTTADAAWKLRPNSYAYDVDVFNSNDNSQFYLSNSDDQGSGSTTSTRLISPTIDLTGYATATLSFYHYYRVATGDTAKVQISTNGGTTWSTTDLASYNTNQGADNAFALVSISLNSFVGNNNIKIRFNYSATWDWYWAIDNVSILGTKSFVTWSPQTGLYTDALASNAYTGQTTSTVYAKLVSDQSFTATSTNPTTLCASSSSVTAITVLPNATYYQDSDGDGFGNPLASQLSCTGMPTGYVTNSSDCNDSQIQYLDADGDGFGSTTQVACGVANNSDCNDAQLQYSDADGDGFGSTTQVACGVTNNSDCNDAQLQYSDADGDGFGSTTQVACGVVNNSDCNDAQLQYSDADGDGFGSTTQVACGVANNSDCNDAQLQYNDHDGDGFGSSLLAACGVANNSDCNDTQIEYLDADGDGFGTTVQVACGASSSGDCNDSNNAVHPNATEVCYDGIDNNCDGTIDEGCTPIVTVIQSSQCGATLPLISSNIYANLVPAAQGYRFKVTDLTTNQVQIIDRALRVFAITQLGNYAFNRSYQIEVSVRYNNVWQPFYGLPCTVTTPATTTTIQAAQCGSSLTTMNDVIFADNVPYSTGYKFRITNLLTSAQEEISRPIRDIRMTNFSNPEYNTTYAIEVAVKNTNGLYLPYGAPCTITTPSFPTSQLQLSQCDIVLTNSNVLIYADSFSGATTYRFRFTNGPFTYSFDRPIRIFNLNTVPSLLPATTYSVQVALEINGVFGPYGKVCTLTTPGGARAVTPTNLDLQIATYPNPFSESFQLSVKTSSEEVVNVKVYDMLGRLVEEQSAEVSEFNELQIGASYPSGIYNVIVSQGDEQRVQRVIKK